MGARFVSLTHSDCSKDDLAAWVKQTAEEHAVEYGSRHSGMWNMCEYSRIVFPVDSVVESERAAEEILRGNVIKWGPLVAVRAREQKTLPHSVAANDAQIQALAIRQSVLMTQVQRLPSVVLERRKASRAKRKKCASCGSMISVAHLSDTNCPVCSHNLLLANSDMIAQKKLQGDIEKIAEAIKARQLLLQKKHFSSAHEEIFWVVAGLCAS